jgi:TP901 family phage tail tape measure protein
MSVGQILAGKAVVLISAVDGTGRILDRIQSRFANFGLRMAAIGSAALAPMTSAVFSGSEFDTQIRILEAVSSGADETAESLANLKKQAMELGPAMRTSPLAVAKMQTELAKAGFSRAETLNMTPATLQLGRASDSDPMLAAEIMGSTLRQFRLDAGQAARVADVLAMTSNKSAIGLQEIGDSMKYIGPLAKGLGMSLEETLALIGVLGNLGIKGEQAGTALRAIEVRAAAMPDKFQEFGITVADAAGNLKHPVELLREMLKLMEKMGTAERAAGFAKLFGMRGMLGAVPINEQALIDITNFEKALTKAAGTAAANAKIIDGGVGGSIKRLSAELEVLKIRAAEALEPLAMGLLKGGTDFLLWAQTFIRTNPQVLQQLATLAAALVAAGVAAAGLAMAFSLLTSPNGLFTVGMGGFLYLLVEDFDMVGDGWDGLLKRMADRVKAGDIQAAFREMLESLRRGMGQFLDEITGLDWMNRQWGLGRHDPEFQKRLAKWKADQQAVQGAMGAGAAGAFAGGLGGRPRPATLELQPKPDLELIAAVDRLLGRRLVEMKPPPPPPMIVQAAARIPDKVLSGVIEPAERGSVEAARRVQQFKETQFLAEIAKSTKEQEDNTKDTVDRLDDLLKALNGIRDDLNIM